jgi:hypothetical protein
VGPAVTDPAGPLDDIDLAVLARIAAVHAVVDPPPDDLDERAVFAIALADMEIEVARRSDEVLVAARSTERTRTITFEAASRTVMVTVVDRPDDLVRIDGWLAPAAPLRVELKLPAPSPARTVLADDAGRFVFDGVPRGLAQLLVHAAQGTGAPTLVTPSLVL